MVKEKTNTANTVLTEIDNLLPDKEVQSQMDRDVCLELINDIQQRIDSYRKEKGLKKGARKG